MSNLVAFDGSRKPLTPTMIRQQESTSEYLDWLRNLVYEFAMEAAQRALTNSATPRELTMLAEVKEFWPSWFDGAAPFPEDRR